LLAEGYPSRSGHHRQGKELQKRLCDLMMWDWLSKYGVAIDFMGNYMHGINHLIGEKSLIHIIII
jgi:hypothetical protein